VKITRPDDRYVKHDERLRIARQGGADLFISIHVNSAPRRSIKGIETFYLSLTTDPWAIKVAAKENAVNTKTIEELDEIVEKILNNAIINESKIFSGFIQEQLIKRLKSRYRNIDDHGVKKAPFYVLVGAKMPSALVEISFLSNSLDARRLLTGKYRDSLARGIYDGVQKYILSLGKK
jgi:N-acetylmuramoyl-L-alanine amidase